MDWTSILMVSVTTIVGGASLFAKLKAPIKIENITPSKTLQSLLVTSPEQDCKLPINLN